MATADFMSGSAVPPADYEPINPAPSEMLTPAPEETLPTPEELGAVNSNPNPLPNDPTLDTFRRMVE